MYNKPMLGLAQCRAAMDAMIADFNEDPSRRPIAMAIVDDTGNLIIYAQTDRCRPSTGRNSVKKAYTAALRSMESGAFAEQLKRQGRSVTEFGDPMLFPLQGGVVVLNPGDGSVLGGIGVAGLPTGQEDEDIARVGMKALNL